MIIYPPKSEWPSGFVVWPEDWPQHHNGTHEPCDMLVGFCSCAAAHGEQEFRLNNGVLERHCCNEKHEPCRWVSPPRGVATV